MCGIAGIWNLDRSSIDVRQLVGMSDLQRHRGPDDEGYCLFDTGARHFIHYHGDGSTSMVKEHMPHVMESGHADLGFGFRRLSIIDLSAQGHQPMTDRSGRYHIVYNGEIYNYLELRQTLTAAGYDFMSNTDTEVVLYAFRHWGEECLHQLNGMWAFAIFDLEEGRLFMSRDRFGEKPLYYTCVKGTQFAFASEIKPLIHFTGTPKVNQEAIYDYLFHESTCHKEFTFFQGLQQLQPGMKMSVTREGVALSRWYHLPSQMTDLGFKESCLEFRRLLEDAISIRERCDVPLGFTLSGGIDSSSIICAIANSRSIELDTAFSLVFPGDASDESKYIQEVLRHLSCHWKSVSASHDDLSRDMHQFVLCQEEPFGLLSYYGEYRLRSLIRDCGVTVTLEGQGADEIVTGYNSLIPYYFESLARDGRMFQLYKELSIVGGTNKTSYGSVLKNTIRKKIRNMRYPEYARYDMVRSDLIDVADSTREPRPGILGLESQMDEMLLKTSIPEQLIRADKSSMAFSTESRFPFLDFRLVEFTHSLPYPYKIQDGVTKRVLRESMKEVLPPKIYQRNDKIGFAVPMVSLCDNKLLGDITQQVMDAPIPFLDKDLFKSRYHNPASIDWSFWKVASLSLWWNAFFI